MQVHDKAIVLQQVKHGDRQLILKLYSRSHGLLTVIASPARTASAKIRPAVLRPLTLLEVNYTLRENHEIHRLSEATCYYVHNGIGRSLAKLSIAQFMNEVLLKTLKEQQSNKPLYDLVESCLNYLNDAGRDFVNAHLYFLRELSRHLGFGPHSNRGRDTPYFDCREGVFSGIGLPFPLGLTKEDSEMFADFLGKNVLREQFSHQQRQWLLEIWLAYYQLHLPNFNNLKSLDVLKEIARL